MSELLLPNASEHTSTPPVVVSSAPVVGVEVVEVVVEVVDVDVVDAPVFSPSASEVQASSDAMRTSVVYTRLQYVISDSLSLVRGGGWSPASCDAQSWVQQQAIPRTVLPASSKFQSIGVSQLCVKLVLPATNSSHDSMVASGLLSLAETVSHTRT